MFTKTIIERGNFRKMRKIFKNSEQTDCKIYKSVNNPKNCLIVKETTANR
jgi:hypothetical protein